MWQAVLVMTLIALVAGLALSLAARRLPADRNSLVEQVNAILPQTQCAQCGYPGCRPYAAAIVNEESRYQPVSAGRRRDRPAARRAARARYTAAGHRGGVCGTSGRGHRRER
ncbi:MAG: RnfABCDGE type electron transport complex subunit B [Woeseiaceae bacterium]|nr:RnfABCDGE type electron transport complex subunit B [Woeseiaceae bacterium]